MTYLKRIIQAILFTLIGLFSTIISTLVFITFDPVFALIYYIKTGRPYIEDYYPLGFSIFDWCTGDSFEWKLKK